MKMYSFPFFAICLMADCLFLVKICAAQNTNAFRKYFGFALYDYPGNIIEGLLPNTYILGGEQGLVSQLNDTGGVVWTYTYSSTFSFQLNEIKKDATNNQYFACGGSDSNAAVFILLDKMGTVIASKKFSLSEADGVNFNNIIKATDGGYVAVGYVTGFDPDGIGPELKYDIITFIDNNGDTIIDYFRSPLIVKLDASGNPLWHKVFRYYTAATKDPITERIYNNASLNDVIEVSDGYFAVGGYDVNQHRSKTDSDGNDSTPTDALILKTTTLGVINFHKQIDNPSSSMSQSSKFLSAVSSTSVGEIIAGGRDDSRELIQKFTGAGVFFNIFSRIFRYSQTFFVNDLSDVSQIYEVKGSTDLVTMTMYVKPLSFFSKAIHRVNATATSNVWAKHYDFTGMLTILPKGSLTSDGGFIVASMGAGGGSNYDFHVMKTDNIGDTPLIGCPATSFSPTAQAGPTTFADPYYNTWVGTLGANSITITRSAVQLIPGYVCSKIVNYSISGIIYNYNSTTEITSGKVYLINATLGIQLAYIDSFTLNGTNGNYSFSNVNFGNYLIVAKPNSSIYPDAIPTYYGDTAFWQGATNLSLVNDTIGINIRVKEVLPLAGIGLLKGRIQYGIGSGKTGNGSVNPFGDPVPDIDIILEEIPGGIKAHTTTDNNGNYVFDSVPINAKYAIIVDFPTLLMDSTYIRILNSDNTEFTDLDFVIDTTSGDTGIFVGWPLSTKELIIQDLEFKIYPNPNDGIFTLELSNFQNQASDIKIFNVLGELIYQTTVKSKQQTVNLNISTGIYNVQVKNEKGIFNRKIIIE